MAIRNISVVLSVNVRKYTDGLRTAASATDQFQRKVSTSARTMTNNANAVKHAAREHSNFEKSLHGVSRGTGSALAGQNRLSSAVRQGNRALIAASGATGVWAKSLEFLKTAAIQSIAAMGGFMFINAAIMGLVRGFGFAKTAVLDFNKAMTESTAIMDDQTAETRANLEEIAKYTSTITTFNPTEAANGLYYLASAGYAAEQSMRLLPIAAKFAQAGVMDLEKATEMLSDVQKAVSNPSDPLFDPGNIEVTEKGMQRVADVVTKAAVASNASLEEVGASFTNKLGAQLRLLNKDIEEGGAIISVYANQGIKGAVAGTQAVMALRDLQTRAIKNADVFKQFGFEVFDTSGKMLHMADIIAQLEGILGPMSDAQKRATLVQMGFQDRSVQALLALVGFSGELREYDGMMRKAGGTTEEVAQRQLKSFISQIELMRNRLAIFAQETGQKLIVGIGRVVKVLTPAFNALRDGITAVAQDLKPVAKVFATVFGAAILGSLAAIGKALEVVGGLMEKFSGVVAGVATAVVVRWMMAKVALSTAGTAIGVGFLNAQAHVQKFGWSLTKTTPVIAAYVAATRVATSASNAFAGAQLYAGAAFNAVKVGASRAGAFLAHPFMNARLAVDTLRTRIQMLVISLSTTGSTTAAAGGLMTRAFAGVRAAATSLGVTVSGLKMAFSGAFTAALVAIPMVTAMFDDMKNKAAEATGEISSDLDLTAYDDLIEAERRYTREWEKNRDRVASENNKTGFLGLDGQAAQDLNPFADNKISQAFLDATASGEKLLEVQGKLSNIQKNINEGITDDFRRSGESVDEYTLRVANLAATMGVDLTRSYDDSGAARAQVESELARQDRAYARAGEAASNFAGVQVEESQAGADAIEEQTKRIGEALAKMYDPSAALESARQITDAINNAVDASGVFNDLASEMEDAAQESAQNSADSANKALDAQKDAIDDQVKAMEKVYKKESKSMSDSEKEAAQERIDTYKEEADARKESLDEQKKASDDFYNAPTVTAGGFLDALRQQAAEMEQYRANMQRIRDMGGSNELILALSEMGDAGVPMIQELGGQLSGEAQAMIANLNAEFAKFGQLPDVAYTEFQAEMAKRAESASAFGNNVMLLSSLGIDPSQLRTILENPEYAGMVQSMIDSIAMAPSAEAKAAAIEDVKSTTADIYAAHNIDTEGFVLAMDLAMAASKETASKGADAIITELGNKFGLTPEVVRSNLRALAKNFGITVPGLDLSQGVPTAGGAKYGSIDSAAQNSRRQANGGIVDFFANGGLKENHKPQIAKAGDWRVWAEPETGGEAYIPLGMNKRGVALPVLAEVARRFGYQMHEYANGGYSTPGSAMVGGGHWGPPGAPQIVPVPVPIQSKTEYKFGDIQGVKLEDAEEYANRKRRQQRLAGGRR